MITNFGSCGAPILEEEADNKEVNNKEELLQIVLKKIKSQECFKVGGQGAQAVWVCCDLFF